MGSISNSNYDEFMNGVTDDGNSVLKTECENLLQSSNYDDDTISEYEKELWQYNEEQLREMKAMLLMNQTDRIEAGENYNMTDIRRKLRNEI